MATDPGFYALLDVDRHERWFLNNEERGTKMKMGKMLMMTMACFATTTISSFAEPIESCAEVQVRAQHEELRIKEQPSVRRLSSPLGFHEPRVERN